MRLGPVVHHVRLQLGLGGAASQVIVPPPPLRGCPLLRVLLQAAAAARAVANLPADDRAPGLMVTQRRELALGYLFRQAGSPAPPRQMAGRLAAAAIQAGSLSRSGAWPSRRWPCTSRIPWCWRSAMAVAARWTASAHQPLWAIAAPVLVEIFGLIADTNVLATSAGCNSSPFHVPDGAGFLHRRCGHDHFRSGRAPGLHALAAISSRPAFISAQRRQRQL